MAVEKITIAAYAKANKVSKQAATKKIRKNNDDGKALHYGLTGIIKVERFGNAYVLHQRI